MFPGDSESAFAGAGSARVGVRPPESVVRRAIIPELSAVANIMGLKMVNSSLNEGGSKTAASGNFKEKTLDQLFDEFYFNIKGKEIDEVRKNEVINILEEIEGKVQ